jgi:hypothetical protein
VTAATLLSAKPVGNASSSLADLQMPAIEVAVGPEKLEPPRKTAPTEDSVLPNPLGRTGILTNGPQEHSKHQQPSWTQFWVTVIGLFTVGAAIRGITKGYIEPKRWWNDVSEFITGRSLTVPTTTFHQIWEHKGLLVLQGNAIDLPNLISVFRRPAAVSLLKQICGQCTAEQPLLRPENFEQALDKPFWRFLRAIKNGKAPDGDMLRRRYNQIITDYYSTQVRDGVFRVAAGHDDQKDIHFIIPIVEKKTQVRRDGMAVPTEKLIFAVISEGDFKKFSDPKAVARLRQDNPHEALRISHFEAAWRLHEEYLASRTPTITSLKLPENHPGNKEPGDTYFPWARVFEKTPKRISRGN